MRKEAEAAAAPNVILTPASVEEYVGSVMDSVLAEGPLPQVCPLECFFYHMFPGTHFALAASHAHHCVKTVYCLTHPIVYIVVRRVCML